MKPDGLCDVYCERITAQSWKGGWCSHPENQKGLEASIMLGGHCPESDQMMNGINHDCHLPLNYLQLLDHDTHIALEPQNGIFHLQDHGVRRSIYKEYGPPAEACTEHTSTLLQTKFPPTPTGNVESSAIKTVFFFSSIS